MTDTPEIDLEALDAYLLSETSPDDCMLLSDLDGFLTALVVGPESVPVSEWLPVIWNDDEPEFESQRQMEIVVGTIIVRYSEITDCFEAAGEGFQPIFWKGVDGAPVVTDWASGFLEGIALRSNAWMPLFRHSQASNLLEPLLVLGRDEEFKIEREMYASEKKFYESAPNLIPTCVIGIHEFWRDWQSRRKVRARRRRQRR